jgi:type IV pilus assembly protein PilA
MLETLLKRLNERHAAEFEAEGSAESGFTLIELMVVLLILAILLAIAIPTFLGVTGSANDRSAQSNLNTALTNAKTIYEQSNQAYPLYVASTTAEPLADQIKTNEPSLPMKYTTTSGATGVTAVTAGNVSAVTDVGNANGAIMMSLANKTNECWWVADNTATMGATPGPVAASAPWSAAAPGATTGPNFTEPATHAGVPQAQGIWYGVYKLGTGHNTCDTTVLATVLSNVNTTAFPPGQ